MDSPSILNPASTINLNLSFKNLSTIEDIRKYKNLIEIDLTSNSFKSLSELSSVLLSFSYLKKVNLAFNKLVECPELPQQIETLILNNNLFKNVDSNLLRMKNLITLDLSNNSIQDISRLTQLSKLKFLFLKNNKVSLISSLINLELLQELDLEGNPVDDREQVMQFKDHQFLRVLNLRNTPVSKYFAADVEFFTLISTSNESHYSNRRQFISPLPNLPFVREGALCRNAKCLKTSYIYAAFTDTCNPNRSALINKSLINQRKYSSSDSEFTDECEEEEDIPHEIPGSILGSVRSNYLESAGLLTSENSTRHERKPSNPGHHQRQGSGHEAKLSINTAKEIGKMSTAHNSNRNMPDKSYLSKTSVKSANTSLVSSKKPAIKLDLSSILKDKMAQPGHLTLQNGLQFTGSNIHTANTSLFNSLNNSQIKISPIVADSVSEKATLMETSTVPHKVLKFNLVAPESNFSTSLRRNSKNSETISPNVMTSDKGNTIQSYINTLLEENNGLKKEVMILRQTNHDLEKMRAHDKIKSTKTSPARRNDSPRLREENARLLAKLSSLEKKHEILKQELKSEKARNQETHKDLVRVATIYLKHEVTPQMDSFQLINQLERNLKTAHMSAKPGFKKRDLSPRSETSNENQKNNQEVLKMTINDLESQIAFKYEEKIAALQRLLKGYKKNLDLVLKKYESLKQSTKEKSISEIHSSSQKRMPLTKLMSEHSTENITYNQNNSLNLTNLGEDTQISEGKDEHIIQLKNELAKTKQALEEVTKKYNAHLLETEELRSDSHKAYNSVQVKLHDLEAENRRLMSLVNKGEVMQSPKTKTVYRCVNLFDNKIGLNRSLEFCPKSSNRNNTSLIADKNTTHHISTKAVNRTSLNLMNVVQPRDSVKTSSSAKHQSPSMKKTLTESDVSLHKEKDSKKGTYTKKLSKILDLNSSKQSHKVKHYI